MPKPSKWPRRECISAVVVSRAISTWTRTISSPLSPSPFRERFNDLQTKLQELDVLHQSSDDFFRTTTPSSRDSGVPVRSSSSCCSLTSDSASTPKSCLELPLDYLPTSSESSQTSVLQFFLHPPVDTPRHVSVHLNEKPTAMSYVHDSIPHYHSNARSVPWTEPSVVQFSSLPRQPSSIQQRLQDGNYSTCYESDPIVVKTQPQRISLNASLPFDSKLNIRIHADRKFDELKNAYDINQVKASATVEPLDPRRRQEYADALQRTYLEHYSGGSPNESYSRPAERYSPIPPPPPRDRLPRRHQVSLPASLPIDQRLYLYIRNGEVLARC